MVGPTDGPIPPQCAQQEKRVSSRCHIHKFIFDFEKCPTRECQIISMKERKGTHHLTISKLLEPQQTL